MISLPLSGKGDGLLNILCLGAHSDDIEIGCGGTLLQLQRAGLRLKLHWVVFTAAGARRDEAQAGAALFAAGVETRLVLKDFKDGYLPYSGPSIKDSFEELKREVSPDIIFTHWQGDAHQDHRLIGELTWNTFRNHFILEYEIPKYDGDMGRPSVFVHLDDPICHAKADKLQEAFVSQRSKPWFVRETFLGLMRLRGMESNAPSGYAEAFYARKILIGAGT